MKPLSSFIFRFQDWYLLLCPSRSRYQDSRCCWNWFYNVIIVISIFIYETLALRNLIKMSKLCFFGLRFHDFLLTLWAIGTTWKQHCEAYIVIVQQDIYWIRFNMISYVCELVVMETDCFLDSQSGVHPIVFIFLNNAWLYHWNACFVKFCLAVLLSC